MVIIRIALTEIEEIVYHTPDFNACLTLNNIKEVGAVVDKPKALGDIRGVAYIYGMFYRFELIDMPDKVNGKMKRAGRQM